MGKKNSLNNEQNFIFNFVEDILLFSLLLGNKLFFSKIPAPPPSPPEYQMVRP